MIYHYLLTRFNLALWIEDKNGAAIDREEWLKRRMALFETFCLPSVKNQSCQNFSWILLVDANTPCLLYTSPSPRDAGASRMPSSA